MSDIPNPEHWLKLKQNPTAYVPVVPTTHEVVLEYRRPSQWQGCVCFDGSTAYTDVTSDVEQVINQLEQMMDARDVKRVGWHTAVSKNPAYLYTDNPNMKLWYRGYWLEAHFVFDLADDTPPPKELIFEPITASRFDVLDMAKKALERGTIKHGNAESSLERIANLWNTYYRQRLFPEEDLTPAEVAEMLTLFKIARNQTRPNTDNYVDGIGYLALAAECAEVSND